MVLTAPALADWDEGDPDKMHYPQLPKVGGWDVDFNAMTLADDWRCSQSGPVSDVHFWISWEQNNIQPINWLSMAIYDDIPDPDGPGPLYSMPGTELWYGDTGGNDFSFTVRDWTPSWQGWFDPVTGYYNLNDHSLTQQVNIFDILEPFVQEEGVIYWLAIDPGPLPYIGWKESGSLHFGDDAVYWMWYELRDPISNSSLDLAFVITPEPATLSLLALGGLALMRRRKK